MRSFFKNVFGHKEKADESPDIVRAEDFFQNVATPAKTHIDGTPDATLQISCTSKNASCIPADQLKLEIIHWAFQKSGVKLDASKADIITGNAAFTEHYYATLTCKTSLPNAKNVSKALILQKFAGIPQSDCFVWYSKIKSTDNFD